MTTFLNQVKKKESRVSTRDIHRYKLYVNEDCQEFWDFVDYMDRNNISSSLAICRIVIEQFKKGVFEEPEERVKIQQQQQEELQQRSIDNIRIVEGLIQLTERYNIHKDNGLDLSQSLSCNFSEQKITPSQLVNFIVFIMEAYQTIKRTDLVRNFIKDNSGKMLESLRSFNDRDKVQGFKDLLRKEIFLDMDLMESQKKEKDRKRREEERYEILRKERREWERNNPGRNWSERNMSEEDIKYFNDLKAGRIQIIGYDYFDKENDINYDPDAIEMNISGNPSININENNVSKCITDAVTSKK